MKRIVTGILAHVDAGKTTLSEALLYKTGQLRKPGRVDHGDAFLDTNTMERARGITIFTEPAIIHTNDTTITLLDTPGHVDFSAETERTIRALDYAVFVISATDGIQGHTETLWRLLTRYNVPTILFVNKMDAPGANATTILNQLQHRFHDACIDFTNPALADTMESIAMQSEQAMDEYLDTGTVNTATIRNMIERRELFPCFFGSALKMEGIDEFIHGFATYTQEPQYADEFGARIYKISHDAQGNRLTWLKVTGGELHAKTMLNGGSGELAWNEKADQIRVYSGAKYSTVGSVPAGTVCAVTGLTRTFPGEGLGFEQSAENPILQPVLTYTLLPGGNDTHKCLLALRELEDEDPLLHVVWHARLQEIHLQLMGAVQLEIIQQMMHDRFGLDVEFGPGAILYKETITEPVEGVGHYEPLRHYAEAHVLLEPLPAGSGMQYATDCSEDILDRNWQRLILSHFQEREHLGVLTGSPITDIRLTLLTGRAHLKHTEGGDFRQATYRAIRQGLMEARAGVPDETGAFDVAQRFAGDGDDHDIETADVDSIGSADADSIDNIGETPQCRIQGMGNCRLLEPWYRFRLEVPQDMLGRAMSDIQRMSGEFDPPQNDADGEYAVLNGTAPVSEMRDYAMDVNAYTHGRGHLGCTFAGYRPCHDAETIIKQANYNPESDLDHTTDSVLCAHGAGYPVKWYKVPEFMHLDYAWDGMSSPDQRS
ncbi:elongation factor G [Bifidobacterium merycicum]|uniref:elongation factor G n=1 Tax=Bifidobacterium merycicum TaxID=78345 RepID=UPI0023F3C72B|nr:TetM/TetW/TetO/TetS family tetracycline resistance ribosomal protection protein [Bifidobacterium merycicum]